MKTYKISIDVYVAGDNEQNAIDNLIGEIDYLFQLDNQLQAYTHPETAEFEHETED